MCINLTQTALMALTSKRALIKEFSTEVISYGTGTSSSGSGSDGDHSMLTRRSSLNLVSKNHQSFVKIARQRAYSVSGLLLSDIICPLGMSIKTANRHGSGSDIITSEVEEEDEEEDESENEERKH